MRRSPGADPRTVPDLGSVRIIRQIPPLWTTIEHLILLTFSLRHTLEAFQDIQGLVHLM